MKYLIYFFLLFSTVVFSQNYDYAIEEAPKKTLPLLPTVNNQLEEIAYFNAYLLPIAQKANLQKALDTYGAVRLEKGDYSGVNIVMHSNQRLYGHPSINALSNVTIASGSSNVLLESVSPTLVTLEAGGVISSCMLKTIKYCEIRATNAMLENNSFINIMGVINFNCSSYGYFRNNKIIKHQIQSTSNQLVMKGNSTTPSYGNVHFHTNFLTSHGDTTDIDGLQSATFVGVDAEGWNQDGLGTKAMFTAKNMGSLKVADFAGANGYSLIPTPAFDVDATNAFFFNKLINTSTDVVSPKTNVSIIGGLNGYLRSGGTVTGYSLLGHLDTGNSNKDIIYNGTVQSTTVTDPITNSNIKNSILGTQYTPWDRTKLEMLPDPLGSNWRTERVGKLDQTSYIQDLINANGIADLPEGVFYISSTLNVPLDNNHGIIGKGTGKTVIVGLNDDFPLITLGYGSTKNFILANLTLQGGSVGIYSGVYNTQIAYQNLKFIVFRDQTYGIQLHQILGLDNNFFEHLGFVNCTKGIFQDPLVPYINQAVETCSYVDKTMFYKSQFINCTTGISMLATRADNLNAWLDCKFDGGKIALALQGNNSPIIANCDFTNFAGANIILTNSISIYSSNFYNNSITNSTINSVVTFIEGCSFLDNIKLFSPVMYTGTINYIFNSTVTGDVVVPKPSNLYYESSAVYSNSKLLSNPTLSKLLVNVKAGVPTVVINDIPNPYPQLLVNQ